MTGNLPCPFCGDRDIRPHYRGNPTSGEWVIECHTCSCELTGFASQTDAWTRWNTRRKELREMSKEELAALSTEELAALTKAAAVSVLGPTEYESILMSLPDPVRNEELGLKP